MKTLKFRPELADLILKGEKTTTWRLFDDKDLQTGDEITLIKKVTGEEFGTAKITWVSVRTFGTLTAEDWMGHEKFASENERYETYRMYYPNQKVDADTIVKILTFDFAPR